MYLKANRWASCSCYEILSKFALDHTLVASGRTVTPTLRCFHGEEREDAALRSTWLLESPLHLLSPFPPACLPAFSPPHCFPGPQGRGCPQPSQQTKLLLCKLLQHLRRLGPKEVSFLCLLEAKDSGDGARLISPGLWLPGRWRDSPQHMVSFIPSTSA